jgi:hypothetical protein
MGFDEKALIQCCKIFARANRSDREAIVYKLKLGHKIIEIMLNADYGSFAVTRLAEALSKKLGYKIYPQRLWECARVAQRFRTIEEIYDILKTRDISWSDVLELCRIKRVSLKTILSITLEQEDSDLIAYKNLPSKVRNDFLKESLRIGIKILKQTKKLPDVENVPSVATFAKHAFPANNKKVA